LVEELVGGAKAIENVLNKSPRLYRPPNGKLTAGDLWRAWQRGLTTVLWNVDPKDYNKQTAREVWTCFEEHPLQAGDLVLFHDNHPHAIAILPKLIATCRSRGLEFTTVDSWTVRSTL
jgi:peptidoglycan/xylan/chitin deacetylase (PgdA/CDA1 family)